MTADFESAQLKTVGVIAELVGEPLHRIEYAIRSRGIKPRAVAGNARVFDAPAVDQIRAALRDIADRKAAGHSDPTRDTPPVLSVVRGD